LVDHDERFVRGVTDLALELDNLTDTVVDELSLTSDEFFSLLCGRVLNVYIDLTLLVL